MTLPAGTTVKRHLGNGVTTVFPYDFFIESEDDLIVYKYDTVTGTFQGLASSAYSVSGLGDPAFGSVTYPLSGALLAATEWLVIRRLVAYSQETDIENQSGFFANVLELGLDRLVEQTQQLANGLTRSIQIIPGDAFTSLLPAAALRANKWLRFDSTGQPDVSSEAIPLGSAVFANQLEAETGTATTLLMSPLRTKQAIVENMVTYDTRTMALDSTTTVAYIRTAGYAVAGDYGGALYKKVGSEPSHPGKFQNADGRWYELNEKIINPLMLGAAGDNIADDATALANAILAVPTDGIIDGLGLTYKCNSPLTLKERMKLRNIKINAAGMGATAKLFNATGTQAAPHAVSAGATAGNNTLTVVSTVGISVGDFVFVTSADVWDDEDGAFMAEIHQVRSKTATVLTLKTGLRYSMTTTTTVSRLDLLNDIVLDGVIATGSGTDTQWGANFVLCKSLRVTNCRFTKFNDRNFAFWRNVDLMVTDSEIGDCESALAYGMQIQGATHDALVRGNIFFNCNYGVDLGDDDGPNRRVVIDGNIMRQMRGGGVGAHPCSDDVTISDNIIEIDPNTGSGGSGGVDYKGANPTITGNRISNPAFNGIVVNDKTTAAVASKAVVNDNEILNVRGVYGIIIEKLGPTANDMDMIIVCGNILRHQDGAAGTIGIFVLAVEASIEMVLTSDNIIRGFRQGILYDTDNTETIGAFVCSNNLIRMPSAVGTEGIFLAGATDPSISNGSLVGNVIVNSPTFGIRAVSEENITVIGNVVNSAGTPVSITATNNVNADNLV